MFNVTVINKIMSKDPVPTMLSYFLKILGRRSCLGLKNSKNFMAFLDTLYSLRVCLPRIFTKTSFILDYQVDFMSATRF